jgi:hypothetical protein
MQPLFHAIYFINVTKSACNHPGLAIMSGYPVICATGSILAEKRKRDRKIAEAIEKYGYTQRSIADHLGVHFTYISRILQGREEGR